ncbi:MAG: hypothetical protein J0I84_18175 [Terrimonas sp.]|nr:hypothetical protein [Terrimonas sp.]OJY88897.1 MAG: hypothetical protein BGP13_02450 [Sphingobacteriales bacterium 40-81]
MIEKIAIVTSSNTGIGLETTIALAQPGATVIVPARDVEKAKRNAVHSNYPYQHAVQPAISVLYRVGQLLISMAESSGGHDAADGYFLYTKAGDCISHSSGAGLVALPCA